VRARFGKTSTASEIEQQRAELGIKEGGLRDARSKEAAAKARSDAAAAAKTSGLSDEEIAQSTRAAKYLDQHSGDIAKAEANLAAAKSGAGGRTPEELREYAKRYNDADEFGVSQSLVQAEKIENAEKALAVARTLNAGLTGVVKDAEEKVKRLETEAAEALSKYEKAKTDADARDTDVKKARLGYDLNSAATSRAQDIATGSELAGAGFKPGSRLGRTLLGNIEAEEARAHGETMTTEQAKGIQQLVSALRQTGHNQAQINKIISDMMDLHKSHEDKLRELATELGQLRQQQRGGTYQ
jgi:hypothetical protein